MTVDRGLDDALLLDRRHERDDQAVATAVRILLAEQPHERRSGEAA